MKRAFRLLMACVAAVMLWSALPAMAAPEQGAAVQTHRSDVAHPAVEGSHAVAADHAGGGHEAPGELVPQTPGGQKQAIYTAIWVVVIFLILLAILYPTAWKGVLAGLKAREDRIRKDIADAEAARAKAEATLAEYNRQLAAAEDRVRELLAKAQTDGERLAATIRDNASKEAEGIKGKALTDIEEARKNAVAQIHAQAAELSTAIAEKIIRKNLNPADQRELVAASLQQLESGRN